MNSVCPTLCFNLDFKATIEKQHINKAKLSYKTTNDSVKMAVSQFELRKLAFQKTNCARRFYIKLRPYCKSLATDLQDYHFHSYTCANIDFKATTGRQHKSEQFHKSSNGSAKNGKMAMYLITSLES